MDTKHSTGSHQTIKETLADKLLKARHASVADFGAIAHRLEFVDEVNGIEFINDSKATDLGATEFSLEFMKKPFTWIISESEFEENYEELQKLVTYKVLGVVVYGKDTSKLVKAYSDFCDYFFDTTNLVDAVKIAHCIAKKGEAVLFSPASPGYAQFENFKHRGEVFRKAVADLKVPGGRFDQTLYTRD